MVNIIAQEKLANGLEFSIIDQSWPVAADRWYVKVVCELTIPLRLCVQAKPKTTDAELDQLIRKRMGKFLEHHLLRERNFVDQPVKEEVVGQIAEQLRTLVCRYLEDEGFPARLYAVKYNEIGKQCALEMARKPSLPDDGPEPDDFSHCFR